MSTADWLRSLDALGFQACRILVSVLWQSTIVLLAAAGLCRLLRRRGAALRHAVWVVAILSCPLLPLVGWIAAGVGAPSAEIPVVPVYTPPAATTPIGAKSKATVPATRASVPNAASPLLPAREWIAAGDCPWALALIVYGTGVCAMLGLVALGRTRLWLWRVNGRVTQDARTVSGFDWARTRLGLRRQVRLVEASGVPTPIALGVLRAVVLLPVGLAGTVSDDELRAIGAHETAHFRRCDPLLFELVSLVRALLFVQPLVWLAARRVSELAEHACDEQALRSGAEPVSYARMLTRLAETLPRRSVSTEMAAGLALRRGAFVRRVRAILDDRRDRLRRLSRVAVATVLAVGLASVVFAAALPLGVRGDAALAGGEASSGPLVHLARWSAMVDAVGGERILASPQHAQTGSTAYEAMWWRGGELLSLLQDLDEQGHVLALEAQHSWMDPSPRHPRAMTFGYAGGDGVWGAGGIYRLSASAGQVDVSLEFSRVDVLWGREPVRGSCLFEGTIKNGDALAFLARVRTREGTDAYHLVVFQAAAFSSSQWPYVACLTSARRLVNLGMPGLAKVADEGIAWAEGAEQASGPAAGKWTKELADGVVVRLVAVGRPAEHPFRWWDGDGRPVKVAPREIAPSTDGERAVLAELTDPNLRAAYPDWRWPHLSCWVLQEDEAHPGRVTVGAGTGPWEAVGTLEGVGNGVEADHAMYLLTEVKPGLRRDDRHNMPGTTNVKMSYTQRVVSSIALAVVDRDGREHLLLAGPPLAGTMPPTGFKATLFTVAPVDVGDIDHFVVKTRPRDWVSFTKIAWEPTVQNAANDRAGTGVGRAEGAQTRSLQGAASDAVGGITSD